MTAYAEQTVEEKLTQFVWDTWQQRGDLRLGDVPVGGVVFHPYWRTGRVMAKADTAVFVFFVPEYDYRNKFAPPVLVREGRMLPLGYHEHISAWEAA